MVWYGVSVGVPRASARVVSGPLGGMELGVVVDGEWVSRGVVWRLVVMCELKMFIDSYFLQHYNVLL